MRRSTVAIVLGIAIIALGTLRADDEKATQTQKSKSHVEESGNKPHTEESGSKPHAEKSGAMPHSATASCNDGSWSSASSKQGACSSHGGVKEWFGKAPKGANARCKDGTYSTSKETQGACSKHGGIAYKMKEGHGEKK